MKEATEKKVCKCGKVLPADYKHKRYEACRNKRIDTVKNVGKGTLIVIGVVVSALGAKTLGSKLIDR